MEDSVLVGYGRGGINTGGIPISAADCVIVNLGAEWGISKTSAVWLEGEDGALTPPRLTGCTLIAADGPCGYGILETTTETVKTGEDSCGQPVYKDVEKTLWTYCEKADMTNCSFLPLSTADWRVFTGWEMEPEPEEPVGALENFVDVQTYTAGQFTDVPETYWGASNVQRAYELGLMKGSGAARFEPDGEVSLAQAIAMAARLSNIYTNGGADFTQGGVWYQTYVDYAKASGIPAEFADYNAPATRAEFAAILAAALPPEALKGINSIGDGAIPDVGPDDAHAQAIYLLYRAGVLTGNDAAGTFGPDTGITRAAAVIITRMADMDLRKNITLN